MVAALRRFQYVIKRRSVYTNVEPLVSGFLKPNLVSSRYSTRPPSTTMETQSYLKAISPLDGHLESLRTVQELHSVESLEDALVAEIDIKQSNKVVKLLDSTYPRDRTLNLSHLRRLTRPQHLPDHLKPEPKLEEIPTSPTIHVLIPPPLPERSALEELLLPYIPTPAIPEEQKNIIPIPRVNIQSTRIPIQPPTSSAQAERWCRTLWPAVYNSAARSASHAPPPVILSRTKDSIEPRAGFYLALAQKLGNEAHKSGRGRGVGVVIVDPELAISYPDDPLEAIVAVAGDSRYCTEDSFEEHKAYNPDDEGRPDHHALMRAISIVSHKRLADAATISNLPPETQHSSPTYDTSAIYPELTDIESHFFKPSNLPNPSRGGYLCNSLDVYTTHEPCLCCAMGMLLSRIRAIVVHKDGIRKGNTSSSLDSVNGYGLHWREELNWRAMGFEFIERGTTSSDEGEVNTSDDDSSKEFHA